MEIIFLGTSSGVPTKTRNMSGIAIKRQQSKAWYLIDCGEGTQHQLLHIANLSLNHLAAICITHVHGDHCYGLPGLLASAGMAGRTAPLTIISPRAIKDLLTSIQTFTQMRLSYHLHFILIEELGNIVAFNDFNIEVSELSHRVSSYAFTFIETKQAGKLNIEKLNAHGINPGPVWGQLQRGEDIQLPDGKELLSNDYLVHSRQPRKVIVAGDNDSPWHLKSYAHAADVLIHEATYTEEIARQVGSTAQHSTAKQVALFAEELSVAHLILTHFSPRYKNSKTSSPCISDIEHEAKLFYHGNLFLANDFDVYQLSKEGELKQIISNPTTRDLFTEIKPGA